MKTEAQNTLTAATIVDIPMISDLRNMLRQSYTSIRNKVDRPQPFEDLGFACRELRLLGAQYVIDEETRRHELLCRGYTPSDSLLTATDLSSATVISTPSVFSKPVVKHSPISTHVLLNWDDVFGVFEPKNQKQALQILVEELKYNVAGNIGTLISVWDMLKVYLQLGGCDREVLGMLKDVKCVVYWNTDRSS